MHHGPADRRSSTHGQGWVPARARYAGPHSSASSHGRQAPSVHRSTLPCWVRGWRIRTNLPRMPDAPTEARAQWRMLAILAIAELLGMSLWFAGSAVAPQLAGQWSLTASEAGWLSTS